MTGILGDTCSGFLGSGLKRDFAFNGFKGGDDLSTCCCGGLGEGVFSDGIGGRGDAEKNCRINLFFLQGKYFRKMENTY